jgi:hypothetical protein
MERLQAFRRKADEILEMPVYKKQKVAGYFSILPFELVCAILEYLDIDSINALQRTCKRMNATVFEFAQMRRFILTTQDTSLYDKCKTHIRIACNDPWMVKYQTNIPLTPFVLDRIRMLELDFGNDELGANVLSIFQTVGLNYNLNTFTIANYMHRSFDIIEIPITAQHMVFKHCVVDLSSVQSVKGSLTFIKSRIHFANLRVARNAPAKYLNMQCIAIILINSSITCTDFVCNGDSFPLLQSVLIDNTGFSVVHGVHRNEFFLHSLMRNISMLFMTRWSTMNDNNLHVLMFHAASIGKLDYFYTDEVNLPLNTSLSTIKKIRIYACITHFRIPVPTHKYIIEPVYNNNISSIIFDADSIDFASNIHIVCHESDVPRYVQRKIVDSSVPIKESVMHDVRTPEQKVNERKIMDKVRHFLYNHRDHIFCKIII